MKRFLVPVVLASALGLNHAHAEPLQFVDTQAQFDPADVNYSASLVTMLQEMDRVGIRRMLIVPPPFPPGTARAYDAEDIVRAIGERTDRFSFLAGGGSLNVTLLDTSPDRVTDKVKADFRARAEAILAQGALGLGEVTAEHLSLPLMKQGGLNHSHSTTTADHPLLLLLADIAAEKDVPIDIHFDIFPRTIPTPERLRSGNPAELAENQAAFERLLRHNPKARFTWAHLGSDPAQQRTPELMRDLLERHPNLYAAFRIANGGPHPSTVLDAQGMLKPAWRKLIEDFSDRFTVHSDMFYVPGGPPRRGPRQSHEMAGKLLVQLPPDLARKLAYENAQRLYRLPE
ncbi:MAG: amidohydrolase family protein [Gammaproteobacteria bacterium]